MTSDRKKGEQMIHFWIIFVKYPATGWGPSATARGGLDIKAYRTKKEAAPDIYRLRKIYGRGRVWLYKFKPEAFILQATKQGRVEHGNNEG